MGDTERKNGGRRRRKKSTNSSSSSSSWSFPTQIVCTAKDAAANASSIQLGLIISLLVVCLYVFAFYEAVNSLPEPYTKRHVGLFNLNLAKLDDIPNTSSAAEKISDQQQQHHTKTKSQITNTNDKKSAASVALEDIPTATWPVRLKDEVDGYETILHPGDQKTIMKVPKFWSPPLHNNQQFTREQAMKVGTCVEKDPKTGGNVRGTDCPAKSRTIFIAIASYRDFQCRKTVESAFLHAKVRTDSLCTLFQGFYLNNFVFLNNYCIPSFFQYPERLRIGVVDQIIDGEDGTFIFYHF